MIKDIINSLRQAQAEAQEQLGVENILQPGIIKELIMADILGHEVIPQKDMPDAKDKAGNFYEYLASINRRNVRTNKGSSFQIDRITLLGRHRITRNKAYFFGFAFPSCFSSFAISKGNILSNNFSDVFAFRSVISSFLRLRIFLRISGVSFIMMTIC